MSIDVEQQLRSARPTVQELLDREQVPVPEALRQRASADLGLEDMAKECYTSRALHDLEVEKLWKRVWQVACREEDIPNVGDTMVYDVAELSVLVVRAAPGVIKAYPNSCQHRGTRLRNCDGHVSELRCPWHAWCWDLQGQLKEVPCRWDFPQVGDDRFRLPEVRVGTWEGFVLVNMDPDAPPLEEYLGGIVDQVASIGSMKNRFKAVHIAKPIRANWKLARDAFMEAYHVPSIHPQVVMFSADVSAQVDVFPGERHWNRMIIPHGIPSPLLGPGISEQDVVDAFMEEWSGQSNVELKVPEGQTARQVMAGTFRGVVGALTNQDVSALTDCQILDTLEYAVFPNLVPIVNLVQAITWRFRPYGNDPETSLMDIMWLLPQPEGAPPQPAAPMQWLGFDDTFIEVPELTSVLAGPAVAAAIDQDMVILPQIQRGLHSLGKGVTFSQYQENRVRHFHQVLDEYLKE